MAAREQPTIPSGALRTRRISLRTVAAHDLPWLYQMCASPRTGVHWRFRGATPPTERFAAELWSGVLCQYIVEPTGSATPIGLVAVYNADLSNGHAYVGSVGQELTDRAGRLAEGIAVLVNFAFLTWPLRKIYIELAATTLDLLQPSLRRYFDDEGTLKEHVFLDGRYQDVTTLSASRGAWMSNVAPRIGRLQEVRVG